MATFRKEKSMLVAYILWFFLGHFGVHRMYLGRVKSGCMMLGLVVAVFATLMFIGVYAETDQMSETALVALAVAWVVSGVILVGWYLVDVVLIAVMVSRDRSVASNLGAKTMETVFR